MRIWYEHSTKNDIGKLIHFASYLVKWQSHLTILAFTKRWHKYINLTSNQIFFNLLFFFRIFKSKNGVCDIWQNNILLFNLLNLRIFWKYHMFEGHLYLYIKKIHFFTWLFPLITKKKLKQTWPYYEKLN